MWDGRRWLFAPYIAGNECGGTPLGGLGGWGGWCGGFLPAPEEASMFIPLDIQPGALLRPSAFGDRCVNVRFGGGGSFAPWSGSVVYMRVLLLLLL